LQEAAKDAVKWQRDYGAEQVDQLVNQLEEKGMQVNHIDHALFLRKAKPV
jgi:TRAP-type C4-dicarboxylate transport system substrate-binding protein